LEGTHSESEPRAFAHLLDQFAALSEAAENAGGTPGTVTGGHHDLGADIWLSTDPAGHSAMACQVSGQGGFRLSLEAGDSGAWACLGMRLPTETLRRGQYLGVLVAVQSETPVSFTPTLRYFPATGGLLDVPAQAPVFLSGRSAGNLSHIQLDPRQLDTALGCELNLFFHNDAFAADFLKIEPLLIL